MRCAAVIVTALALLPAAAAAAGIAGVSYTLTPGAEWVQWDEDLGLKDDVLYGGRLSLNFGRYIALRGHYFGNTEIETDFSSIDLGTEDSLGAFDTKVDYASYGADVQFAFGSGLMVPLLYGGGGINRFSPDGGERSNVIGLKVGAGLRFGVANRFEGLIYVEDNMFRLNRALLLPTEGDTSAVMDAPIDDPDSDDLRHNLVFGAGLSFFLGGYDPSQETALDRAYRRQFAGGLSSASFKFEPYAGWMDYDKSFGFDDQQFVGARMGVGIGELVDVMGFYWRGVEGDFRKTEQIQSWGGEMDFNLNPGPGVAPRLLIGAGSLDFMSGFSDDTTAAPDDKVVFIVGAGLDFNLGRRFRAEVKVRDYMFSETDVSETRDPDEVLHNWVYSAGLTFGFGGGAPDRERIDELGRERWGMPPSTKERVRRIQRPLAVEKEIIRRVPAPTTGEPPADQMASPVRTHQGDRVVTLPVPTTGEIYIRYGEPGAVSIETKVTKTEGAAPEKAPEAVKAEKAAEAEKQAEEKIRTAVREEIEKEIQAEKEPAAPKTPAEADSIRLERQFERLEDRLLEKIDKKIQSEIALQPGAPAAPQPSTVVVTPGQPAAPGKGIGGVPFKRTLGYTGVSVDEPEQFVFGVRLEMGPVGDNPNVYFLPELGFGVFNAGSLLIAGNVRWDVGGTLKLSGGVNPYVYGGPGLLFFTKKVEERDKTEGVFNLGYGLSKDFGTWTGFIEHQGVDIYSLHRILVGANIGF
ncbi:MAG: hypothetical protein ABIH26_07450 [Candidatus Eisenbacteria bacterium]